MGTLLTRKVRT